MRKIAPGRKRLLNNTITYAMVIIAFVVLQVLNAGGILSPSLQGQLVPICAYVTMAISLNLVVGISGELSLGHAGFMSVGAFSGVVTNLSLQSAIPSGPLRLLVSMVIGAVLAGIAGTIVGVPVLRLRGDYLAIVTLAFGEIIKTSSTFFISAWTKMASTSPRRTRWRLILPRAVSPFSRGPWASPPI